MTRDELGAHFGITGQAVYNWERKGDRPDVEKYPTLRCVLRVTYAYLHTGDDDPPDENDPLVLLDDQQTPKKILALLKRRAA